MSDELQWRGQQLSQALAQTLSEIRGLVEDFPGDTTVEKVVSMKAVDVRCDKTIGS